MEAAVKKNSDQPVDVDLAVKYEMEAFRVTDNIKELNGQWERLIKLLSVSRAQRIKLSSEQKITLALIIKSLDDVKYEERVGKYGNLLATAKAKKFNKMVEDGLIIMSDKQPGDNIKTQNEETTE